MFGLNSYLIGGVLVLVLLLSGTTYFFYSQNQLKVAEITQLKEVQIQLNNVIDNRNTTIDLLDKNMKIKDDELRTNREALEKKNEELKAIDDTVSNEPGINDDAAPSLKKLFESLKGRK